MPPGFGFKGSDFTSHTQNQLIKELQVSGIELFPERTDIYSSKNLDRIAGEILASKRMLEFLLENLNPGLPERRLQLVAEYLHGRLADL